MQRDNKHNANAVPLPPDEACNADPARTPPDLEGGEGEVVNVVRTCQEEATVACASPPPPSLVVGDDNDDDDNSHDYNDDNDDDGGCGDGEWRAAATAVAVATRGCFGNKIRHPC
jgi:hypothetical protein